jgi:hypothetical protein
VLDKLLTICVHMQTPWAGRHTDCGFLACEKDACYGDMHITLAAGLELSGWPGMPFSGRDVDLRLLVASWPGRGPTTPRVRKPSNSCSRLLSGYEAGLF